MTDSRVTQLPELLAADLTDDDLVYAVDNPANNPTSKKLTYLSLKTKIKDFVIGSINKASIGLDQVDNTSDADKPFSSVTASAFTTVNANVTSLQTSVAAHQTTLNAHQTLLVYQQSEITALQTQVGSGGVTDHAALSHLDYAHAGHTGFQPAGAMTVVAHDTTLTGDGTTIPLGVADGNRYLGAMGTTTIPTYSFLGDATTGIYSPAKGQINVSLQGSILMNLVAGVVNFFNNVLYAGKIVAGIANTSGYILTIPDQNGSRGIYCASPASTGDVVFVIVSGNNMNYGFGKNAAVFDGPVQNVGSDYRPSYSDKSSPDSGLYFPASHEVGISCGGVGQMRVTTTNTYINQPLNTLAGVVRALVTVTASTTLTSANHKVVCNSATPIVLSLPTAASSKGLEFVSRNIGAGSVTFGPLTLTTGQYGTITSDGTNWLQM